MAEKVLMKGNEAIAEAAVRAGCRFYFAYPITPQNEIPAYMAKRLPEVGGTFLQAESELAAINMVMGASAAGSRCMTSSSSPGISLKQEGISYISGAQLPAVVVNMMRGGPGLGNISGAQGDYFQATRGGGNGDYHVVVIAPGTVQEMAKTPDRKQNKIMSLKLSGIDGELNAHTKALFENYQKIQDNETMSETFMCDDADYILTGYGTCARVCKKAVKMLREQGIKAGLFRPITLWPFPAKELEAACKNAKKILTVEMSMGQMVQDVKLNCGRSVKDVDFYGEPGGIIPSVDAVIEKVKSYE